MMPLTGMRTELEKSASKTGDLIFRGLGGTLKFMGRHPKATAATVAGGAIAIGAANKIHDIYHIMSEERKRGLLKGQTSILRKMLEEQQKTNKMMAPPPPPRHRLKKEPLS